MLLIESAESISAISLTFVIVSASLSLLRRLAFVVPIRRFIAFLNVVVDVRVPRSCIPCIHRIEYGFVLAYEAIDECFFTNKDIEVNNATQSRSELFDHLCKR